MPGIAGVDEAGRGPLAGPVIAAAVVLAPGQAIDGVRDSKQLTARQRQALVESIRDQALSWSIARADREEIDSLNILQATMLAMQRAVLKLECIPGRIQIDGNHAPRFDAQLTVITETVVGGDRKCPAIAAASILAKVYRDDIMIDLHLRYPEYGFDRHKGYPTADHRAALERYGPCDEHRRSFRPVRAAMDAVERMR